MESAAADGTIVAVQDVLLEAEGGRVTRVILDYELKREYQRFLHRDDRPEDATLESDRRAFAEAHDLTVVRGHLELPDVRIAYETADGRVEHRDVEVVTEHYSRGQLSGKARAGFVCYRASGSQAPKGGTPPIKADPVKSGSAFRRDHRSRSFGPLRVRSSCKFLQAFSQADRF